MKRSEMINILKEEFPKWNDVDQLDDYDFHGILCILEKNGMLPPMSNKTQTAPGGYVRLWTMKWEPEDER